MIIDVYSYTNLAIEELPFLKLHHLSCPQLPGKVLEILQQDSLLNQDPRDPGDPRRRFQRLPRLPKTSEVQNALQLPRKMKRNRC